MHTPNCNDVLSGRGGRINSHSGNINFRKMVESLKRDYLDPRTKKLEKARIAARLVATVRRLDPPGRFLKEDPHTGMWIEIGDERAWKKAGQALRESAPEIRAEQQAQLQAAVVAASIGSQGKSAMGVSATPNSNGGRRTDPPGPRHRPNPPEREGLARARDACDTQQFGSNQQHLQEDDDLELNQLRKEYYQMKRMQQEQQARMQQYQQNQGSFFDNQSRSQMTYQQQNHLENSLLAVTSVGFSMPLSHESQQIQHMQQIINMQNKQSSNFDFQQQQQQQQQQLLSNAFERQFNSCDKTVSSMSTFDVHSMDMSSLDGFSSFTGNQSQNISFAGNLSQGMSINSIESIPGKTSSLRKSALERKLEKFNEEHRRQRATHEQQQQQKTRAPANRNVQGQNVSTREFAAIDEDDIADSSFKVSNLGFSEMEMTFNSDNLSIRSKSIPQAGAKEESLECATKQPRVTASSIFDQSAGSDNIQSFSKANVSTRKGLNNSNISMEDFEESFRSMDMDDNRIGPVDPDGHIPVSGIIEKKNVSSQSRRTGRQREPAGDRLLPFQPGMRYSGGTATDTTASRRGSGERNSLGSAAFGLSSNTLGLSDPLMGDFGVSMHSLRSFQSQGSDASSWLNHYQSMENIGGNEKNPWEDECGSPNSSMSEISSHRMATAGF